MATLLISYGVPEGASSQVTGPKLNGVKVGVKRNSPTSKIPWDVIRRHLCHGERGSRKRRENGAAWRIYKAW